MSDRPQVWSLEACVEQAQDALVQTIEMAGRHGVGFGYALALFAPERRSGDIWVATLTEAMPLTEDLLWAIDSTRLLLRGEVPVWLGRTSVDEIPQPTTIKSVWAALLVLAPGGVTPAHGTRICHLVDSATLHRMPWPLFAATKPKGWPPQ